MMLQIKQSIKPDIINGIKLEMFIFDSFALANLNEVKLFCCITFRIIFTSKKIKR